MDIQLWFTFVIASGALLMIPGPTVLLVLSYALSQGRPVAVATALGVGVGDFLAMTVSLLGFGALVLASASLFTILKTVGAVYLIYLGVRLIRSAPRARLGRVHTAAIPAKSVFFHAMSVTALNPKSGVFFIAFVPQFVDANAALLPQFAILIATFVSMATINALVFALLADRMRVKISKPSVIGWLTRIGGGGLIAMGVMTAAFRRAG
ncbi:MAG: LysE family translocator [Rhodobacteraceae bacterium]|nr:LysE family translocator [Paracoccaceae bacterium]